MRATLRDLIESAPDAPSRTALSGLTTPIAELHGAIDAIAMSADPSIQTDGASVAQLATQLHTASASGAPTSPSTADPRPWHDRLEAESGGVR